MPVTLHTQNYPFLSQLGLRTIVSLTPDIDSRLAAFSQTHGITLVHIHVDGGSGVVIKPKHVRQFLNLCVAVRRDCIDVRMSSINRDCITLQPESLPLLVHCLTGIVSTGLAVMCLRKLQNISSAYAEAEFARFTRCVPSQCS